MISTAGRYALDRMNSTALVHRLGLKLHSQLGCVIGNYDFAVSGGAVSDINLKDVDGNDLKLPAGALIMNVAIYVNTAVTSAGSATIDLNAEAANDCAVAIAKASLTLGATVLGIPDFATVADYVRTTAERTLSISINTAALTAGKLTVLFMYVQT